MERIGFGGGCHWCTEAVFQSLKGVEQVEQGFIASAPPNDALSEAVIVHFNPHIISLEDLVAVHLDTHSSTSTHVLRGKYRSAIYVFSDVQSDKATKALASKQAETGMAVVTQVLPFVSFKPSDERFQTYYKTDLDRPFCRTFIDPKLNILRKRHGHALASFETET